MEYQVLDDQQLLVALQVYPNIDGNTMLDNGSWYDPESILDYVHDCPSCKCVHITNPERQQFEAAVKEAKADERFKHLVVSWSKDGGALALIGLPPTKKTFSSWRVLLGQWQVVSKRKYPVPSYEETLERLRREYWNLLFSIGRIIGVIFVIAGMVCVAPMLPHLLDKNPDQETLRLMMKALFGVLIPLGAIPLWFSFKKYRALYKRSPSIKFLER